MMRPPAILPDVSGQPPAAAQGGVRARMVLWASAAFAGHLAFDVAAWAGVAVLATAAVAILMLLAEPWLSRAVTIVALAPVVLESAGGPVWLLPLAAVAVALLPGPAQVPFLGVDELQRHLDRARRRDEPVHLVLARAESVAAPKPSDLASTFRVADSVLLRVTGRHYEIVAVLDDQNLDRAGVERRLHDRLPGSNVEIGWALFPGDGYSVSSLAEHARERLGSPALTPVGSMADASSSVL